MSLVEWTNDLSVGIDSIDIQHKTLFNIINQLYDVIKSNEEASLQSKIFDDLILYTVSHFSNEERYFAQFNYPLKEQHKAEHDQFIKVIKDFSKNYYSGKKVNYMDVLLYLLKWQKKHIASSDKEYSEFFISKGLV